jgi:hypothetical protein
MKIALFATTERPAAGELVGTVRARWPDASLVVFANDQDRAALQAAAPGVAFRRDKPPGGKVSFVKALRAERFDLVVVAWHGGERIQPLRVVALLIGCRALVFDERGRERMVAWWQPWRWGAHLLRRGLRADALQVARAAAMVYRWTLGAVLALVWLPLRALLGRLGGGPQK